MTQSKTLFSSSEARFAGQHCLRRFFVLNENDELIGITSLGDLATATVDRQLAGEILLRVSDSAEVPPEQEQDFSAENANVGDSEMTETRITGLFVNSEQAKEAVEECYETPALAMIRLL